MLKAWVPLKKVSFVKSLIDSSTESHSVVEVEDVGEDDSEVPTLQNNPKIIKPYELLVNMYSPLRYNEVDPTFLLFIIFPFFFGFFSVDICHGIILVILGVVLLREWVKLMKLWGILVK
jgi:V/A-type H+-transporting ATPase subunit I